MANVNSPAQSHTAFLRRKMIMSRIIGIFSCLLALTAIILMYYKVASEWLCTIAIGYALATIFSNNSILQGAKTGNPWQRINLICAILFYIIVIALIILGFSNGALSTKF